MEHSFWKIIFAGVVASFWVLLVSIQDSAADKEALATIAPSQISRPGFIGDVSPPEGSFVPLNVYRTNVNEHLIHEGVRFEDDGYDNSICVAIDTGPVLEAGDNLTDNKEILKRLSVDVDETTLTEVVYLMWLDILAVSEVQNAEGAGWVVFCWDADLGVGKHKVTVKFRQTSGKIQDYTWQFEITAEEVILPTVTPKPRDLRNYNPTIDHIPLCNEPSSEFPPRIGYREIVPGQSTLTQLHSQFDDLVSLRCETGPMKKD